VKAGAPLLIRAILVGGLLALIATNAGAYCSKPDAPTCSSRYGAFDDEYDFTRCRRQMESYRSDVESFLDCLKRESDELKPSAAIF
jgi:hypothetical protein